MMVETDIKITRFDNGDFYVDVIEYPESFEAWISHKDYAVSKMMVGIGKSVLDFDSFVNKIVAPNVDLWESIYEETTE